MAFNFTTSQFARSLFTVAENKDDVFEVKYSLEQLVKLYRKNPEFRFILSSKRIEKTQKLQILKNVLTGRIDSLAIEILNILLDKDIVRELPAIMSRYQNIVSEKTKSAQVLITVSESIGEQQISNLKKSIETKINKKIDIQLNVNPEIMGGMVLRLDNTIIDGSIKRQLEKIRKHFVLN
ncbi:MAG: ATP synthase F1 subunit delta [Candidatus Marinimicrobia bacterium]|nr:ATP synthase F1 subunit delta [Candidatus Neomarinimicrobiota bacterium]|tara:strand:- start:5436 stop:5975 length:540 start_codon:yes stop_codon:yes gene_type:complete